MAGPPGPRQPIYLDAQCSATAIIADPVTEWGSAFALAEPVFEITRDDGRVEYYSANWYYLVGGASPCG